MSDVDDDYVVESDISAYRRRQRRRRSAITLGVVLLILFGAFWYSYSYYKGSDDAVATPTTTCTGGKPVKVTVNVYNATSREGLAGTTAETLKKRGFTVGTIANDPLERTVKGTAEVRYGKAGATQAKVVAATVTKPKLVKDKRKSKTVDLVLGDGFKSLTSARAVTSAHCTTATK